MKLLKALGIAAAVSTVLMAVVGIAWVIVMTTVQIFGKDVALIVGCCIFIFIMLTSFIYVEVLD